MSPPVDAIFNDALVSFQAGRLNDAEKLFKKVLRRQPKHVPSLNLLAVLLTRLEKYRDAEIYVRSALDLNSNSDATFYNYGTILKALGRPDEALEQFGKALSLNAGIAETWNNRGTVFNDLKRYDEAVADFAKAISLQPYYPEAYSNQGKSLAGLKRHDEAIVAYDRALSLKPALAEAWVGRGNTLADLRRYDEAFAALEKALSLTPTLAEAWLCCGKMLSEFKQFEKAAAAYDKALSLKPDLAEIWLCKAQSSIDLKQHKRAITEFDKALSLNPDAKFVEGRRLGARQAICDWADLDTESTHLLSSIRAGKPVSETFALLGIASSPADQLQCAKMLVADRYPEMPPVWRGEMYGHDRVRVAYLSSDFRKHAIAYLIAEVIERHDRNKFEIIGISFGSDDGSDMRSRIVKSFDQFYDVSGEADFKIAELMRRLEIDIAIDLNNYSVSCRPGILAYRPAPLQASYLGYPATMGASYIDYAIVDKFVLPQEQQIYWTEKFVFMPDSYLAHDTVSKRLMPPQPPTRAEVGLPDGAFVFCCFNNSFKITPEVFEVWMRLIKAVDGSVLWFSPAANLVRATLSLEAERAGVDPQRLIFASYSQRMEDHLSRHRAADLFLDTLLYNAHTTAADALWAGLPVLTCAGKTFPGRVAGSLLHAIGLPELVTDSLEAYEALALQLAQDPARLANLKSRLAHNRDTHPLFDTARFTRHLEAAYVTMMDRHARGMRPAPFAVDPIS